MKLEKWALIAEIVGAAAIVLSLIFVGLEVRRHTDTTFATTYDDLLDATFRWRLEMVSNPDAYDAWLTIVDIDTDLVAFREEEPAKYELSQLVFEAAAQNWERAFIAHSYSQLNDLEWERFRNASCRPETKRMIALNPSQFFLYSRQFWEYLQTCEPAD